MRLPSFARSKAQIQYLTRRSPHVEVLDYMAFSRSGLIDQLEYEGFTTEQASYGVDKTGL
jgi:hypothetical protein